MNWAQHQIASTDQHPISTGSKYSTSHVRAGIELGKSHEQQKSLQNPMSKLLCTEEADQVELFVELVCLLLQFLGVRRDSDVGVEQLQSRHA